MKKISLLMVCFFLFLISCADAKKDKIKLEVWHIQTSGDLPVLKEESAKRFIKDNPGYDVNIEAMQNDAYKTKIKIALGANTAPDVLFTWSGGPMIDYIKADKLVDLTPYMEKNNYADRFLEGGINQASYEGKIWAVPIENTVAAMIFYNKDLFDKNGWTVPKTISELETLADKMLAKGIKPFALANKTKWTGSMYYMYLVDRIGGREVFDNAANRVNGGSFANETFIKAGKKIVEWVDKGYFNEGFNGLDEDTGQSRTLMYTEKAAMQLIGSWFLSTVNGENPDFIKKIDAFPFPVFEGGKGDPKSVVGTIGDNFYSVSKTSKDPEAAFKLITYFLDEQGVKDKLKSGSIPPLKGIKVDDVKQQKILDIINEAPYVQLWYDQYLPSELTEVHKDTLQAMFGKTMTPEDACKEWEAQAVRILGPSK